MERLRDKIALVTGSNGGIAFATAKLFAKEGALVYVNGRRRELVEEQACSQFSKDGSNDARRNDHEQREEGHHRVSAWLREFQRGASSRVRLAHG
ncbi:MAG: SDR family NAD(P)-dependent oxidoreductase [Pseudomonadota bacterium]